MEFKPGDKVRFLNEQGQGRILSLESSHRALVLTDEGFELSYPLSALVKDTMPADITVDSRIIETKDHQPVKAPHLSFGESWEVDLHLEEVPVKGRIVTDHEKLKTQMAHFHECMNVARVNRIQKVVFIHGVGKGTLKAEILHALKKYERVRWFDAPFKRYGFGAIQVEFF